MSHFQRMLLAFITSLTLSASTLLAMEIEEVQESQIGCTIRISGYISEDAGEEFLEWYVDWRRQENPTYEPFYDGTIDLRAPERLCFDSPGGSFLGGVALAQRLGRVSTGVDAGHRCESACFIIFMSGFFDPQEDRDWFADRVMHPTSAVGFHRPGISIDNGAYTSDQLMAAWEVSLDATDLLLDLVTGGRSGLNSQLLGLIYDIPHVAMRYIETVDDANTFGITVYPVSLPELVDESLHWYAANVCAGLSSRISAREEFWSHENNFFDAEVPTAEVPPELIFHSDVFRVGASLSNEVRLEIMRRNNGAQVCQLEFRDFWGELGSYGQMRPDWGLGSVSLGEAGFGDSADDWFIIPAVTESFGVFMLYHGSEKIIDLPSGDELYILRENMEETGSLTRFLSVDAGQSAAVTCNGPAIATVKNVNEYVNIRTQPSLRAPIVAPAQLGESLTLMTPDQWWVLDTPRGRQCSQLCQQATSSPALQPALRQCIEEAEIWHQVRNARGQTGYVSVYFLGD